MTDLSPSKPNTHDAAVTWHHRSRHTTRGRVAVLAASALLTALVGAARTTPARADGDEATATLSTTALNFGDQRVGTYGDPIDITVTNTGSADLIVSSITVGGPNVLPGEFSGYENCTPAPVAPALTCTVRTYFSPDAPGVRSATIRVNDSAPGSPQTATVTGNGTEGYFLAGSQGEVGAFGDATFEGDVSDAVLNAPIVNAATTPNGDGYWLLGRDGGIFSFGEAAFFGSTGGMRLNQPVDGMASTADGLGYWLVASDGGIFTFGDAAFFGSTGAVHLNRPIVGMAATPDGRRYWLVASDGGIFTDGDAPFYGSIAGQGVEDVIGIAGTAPPVFPVSAQSSVSARSGGANRSGVAGASLPGQRPQRRWPR